MESEMDNTVNSKPFGGNMRSGASLEEHLSDFDKFDFKVMEQFGLDPLTPRTFMKTNKS